MFGAPKNKTLGKCYSTSNMNTSGEESIKRHVLYKTVMDNFNMTSPSIRLAEEVSNFLKKSPNGNQSKVKGFVDKVTFIVNDIKHKEFREEEAKKKKIESQQKKVLILPKILPSKSNEKNDTVSSQTALPQNFAIRQLIKNHPQLTEDMKKRPREDTDNVEDYYNTMIKRDTQNFFVQQKLRKQQKRYLQQKYREDLEEQMKEKEEKQFEAEKRNIELDRILMQTSENTEKKQKDKDYINDLNKILEDKVRKQLKEYMMERSFDRDLVKNNVEELNVDRIKQEEKRKLNKDIQDENKKLEEIKKGFDMLVKEKEKENELKLILDQEKLQDKSEVLRKSEHPDKPETTKLSKTTRNNFYKTYEEHLRKLQQQSLNKCKEIEEKIAELDKKIGKPNLGKPTQSLNKKDIRIIRPIYNQIGTDNHVSAWKSPEDRTKRLLPIEKPTNNSKSVAVESFKAMQKSPTNGTAFFATQINQASQHN